MQPNHCPIRGERKRTKTSQSLETNTIAHYVEEKREGKIAAGIATENCVAAGGLLTTLGQGPGWAAGVKLVRYNLVTIAGAAAR
jgi:hypothetical protein